MCASPSAHSDSSSGNGRLSSAGSEAGGLNNNNNNCTTKLNEILRSNNGLHQQYNVEEQLHNANRMAVIANMVNQGGVPPGLGSDSSAAAANIAAANIANLAMRLGVSQVTCFIHYFAPFRICASLVRIPLESLLFSGGVRNGLSTWSQRRVSSSIMSLVIPDSFSPKRLLEERGY